MTKHYNSSISEDALRILNSKQGDFLTDEVAGPVAVLNIEPSANIVRNNSSTATGNLNAWTTPADKDFYLTSLAASFSKNAACDQATGRIQVACTIDGVSKDLLAFAVITLTAERETQIIVFDKPIKLDRNAGINFAASFTAGVMSRWVGITGYTRETTR